MPRGPFRSDRSRSVQEVKEESEIASNESTQGNRFLFRLKVDLSDVCALSGELLNRLNLKRTEPPNYLKQLAKRTRQEIYLTGQFHTVLIPYQSCVGRRVGRRFQC